MRHSGHDERFGQAVAITLVATVPHGNGRMVAKPFYLVLHLRRFLRRSPNILLELHVRVEQDSKVVASIIKCTWLPDATAPRPQHVHVAFGRRLDELVVRLC